MNGVLVIDKPAGLTSFDVVRQVRKCCKTRRVGHTGTLDPFATGVLPVALGQATRLVEYLMVGKKQYLATVRLGETTDTQDLTGILLKERPWQQISREQFERVTSYFVGTIKQVPPMYSAIKQGGQPLYRLARQGLEVERKAREVEIDEISMTFFDPPDVGLHVVCGKGTYIRSLAHDIGEKLGCGAHLIQLRRSRVGIFDESHCLSLSSLSETVQQNQTVPLITPAEALSDWPCLQVHGSVLQKLQNGISPSISDLKDRKLVPKAGQVRFQHGERLVAVAKYQPSDFSGYLGDFQIMKVFPEVSS